MQAKHHPPDDGANGVLGVPLIYAILCGLACAATLPLRYGEGLLGIGRNGLFAVCVIFAYASLVPCPPLLLYGVFFLAVVAVKRPARLLRHAFGNRQESGWEGWPLPCLIGLPCWLCRQLIEPCYVAAIGWYLRQADPSLGLFFLAGAAATFTKTTFEHVLQFNRSVAASDVGIRMRNEARKRAKRGY